MPKVHVTAFIEESARVIGDVEVEEDSSVWFNCVIRGDVLPIRVGRRTNIQDGSILHPSNQMMVRVGDNVTVGHGAVIHGCTVQSNCLIGMRATIMDKVVIGEWSIVGAGALVTEGTDIPSRSVALGIPAKVVRSVDEEDLKLLRTRHLEYVELKDAYLRERSRNRL